MSAPIEAIFFDVNGTLRSSVPSSESRKQEKVGEILRLVGIRAHLDEFSTLLTTRAQAYRHWAREGSKEISEVEFWTRWMLPDHPAGHIRQIALQLHQLWREATGIRTIYPEAKDVLLGLFRRGYRLGIVSNTFGSLELLKALRDLEISGLLETVVLSSEVGVRKPDPAIMLEATSRLHLAPAKCAYVGNRYDRDVIAARGAGFSKTVIIQTTPTHAHQEDITETLSADHTLENLRELLEIFPALPERPAESVYQATFSTIWARHNTPTLSDFFEVTRRLGFAGVELNHQIDSAMLHGLDLSRYPVRGIHEPCPADVSAELLKERDWLISSIDEGCRNRGVEAIKRSIDLAGQLHLPVLVVHSGMVSSDMALEQKLRRLFNAGGASGDEYREVKGELIEIRRRLAPGCLEAAKKSLRKLLDHAGRCGVRLGLENRYHYFDLPSPDEMFELLELADESRLGFVYDVGHAQALDRLGFYAHEDWLRRFSTRMLEVHLHDVRGVHDHLAPGLGEVDFDMVARYLPKGAIRTLELQPTNSTEDVRAGLQHLAQHGCIRAI